MSPSGDLDFFDYMDELIPTDNQELAPEDTGDGEVSSQAKGRKAFKNVRRELSDDELSLPAVQRLLIDEIERLEQVNMELRGFQVRFFEADKNTAVLNEKLKANVAQDIIFGVCLTVGAALISVALSYGKYETPGLVTLAAGLILIVAGIASKVVKR